MNNSSLPVWLKWVCRIAGVLLICAALWALAITGLGLWLLAKSKEGLLAQSGMLLAEVSGRLVGYALVLWLGIWLLRKPQKRSVDRASASATTTVAEPTVRTQSYEGRGKRARSAGLKVHSCNVLHASADKRRVWQFESRNGQFTLGREQTTANGEALPFAQVTKTWRSLWQPKLNIAWLPPENVFLRVIQLPKSSLDETCAMVELQLEKLSPIPVAQVVWSLHVWPQAGGLPAQSEATTGELQTVIVMLAEREAVEQFLGQLEGQGYLADCLEIPVVDQLQATAVDGDGAWIYPAVSGEKNSAVVAWWAGGALRNLNLISVPETGDPAAGLAAQLSQLTMAGELEGWLKGTPAWHLVAEAKVAVEWEAMLRPALEAPVEVHAPLPPAQLAGLTAKRAASSGVKVNLLPKEFSTRYMQQFHDRLWMRGLGAVLSVYVVCVVIYLLALAVFGWRTESVVTKTKELGPAYTNAMQLEARLEVLKDRHALKFAALDCWKAVAETLPGELQLEGFTFTDGRKLQLNGSAPAGSEKAILDFSDELRKSRGTDAQLLFGKTEIPNWATGPGGGLSWRFNNWELKRAEAP